MGNNRVLLVPPEIILNKMKVCLLNSSILVSSISLKWAILYKLQVIDQLQFKKILSNHKTTESRLVIAQKRCIDYNRVLLIMNKERELTGVKSHRIIMMLVVL